MSSDNRSIEELLQEILGLLQQNSGAAVEIVPFETILKQLREPMPSEALEYRGEGKNKRPFFSHEWYRKRLIDVNPPEVEFKIHDTDFKTLTYKGNEYITATANTSLRIGKWTFSALGTHNVYTKLENPNELTDPGSALKSAISNGFVGCCKQFLMGVADIAAIKGEKYRDIYTVPGDKKHPMNQKVEELQSARYGREEDIKLPSDSDPLIGDKCMVCQEPRRQSDYDMCVLANVAHLKYCRAHIPDHAKKKAGMTE